MPEGSGVPTLIGTSGWHYKHWKGGFYPANLPTSGWLKYYADRFATVELNSAFYRLPEAATFDMWAGILPEDFVVAVKVSRYLTHVRRLRDAAEPVRHLLERAAGLGSKLGPLLLQLPPNFKADADVLGQALGAFPSTCRVVVEFRHPSWFADPVRTVLERHGAALCLADNRGSRTPLWVTADWGYLRCHDGRARPASCYGQTALDSWAERLAQLWPASADVFVYFNNDMNGCAPHNAHQFALAARRAGLCPTRVPSARETPLSGSAPS